MRVLQISMGEMFGGVEKIELDWARNIDKNIKFDFLTPNDIPFKKYENEIKNLDGNVFNMGVSRKNLKGKVKYASRLYKFLRNNKYKIVHINSSAFFFSLQVVLISKLCNVEKIIVHTHSPTKINSLKKLFIKILNPLYIKCANKYLTCSENAKNALFTQSFINKNKIRILKNGIEIEKFKFSENIRNEYKSKYGIRDNIVYGHIGNFSKPKNHEFLIDIFYEIQKIQKEALLVLVGDGELQEEIKKKVRKLKIENKVKFLGFRKDANKLLNIMDIFIFPSLYEGLGIAVVEAQTNGVTTYCSQNIPIEAKVSKNFIYFDLNESAYSIAQKICNTRINGKNRKEAYKDTTKNGYDIKIVCEELKEIYIK